MIRRYAGRTAWYLCLYFRTRRTFVIRSGLLWLRGINNGGDRVVAMLTAGCWTGLATDRLTQIVAAGDANAVVAVFAIQQAEFGGDIGQRAEVVDDHGLQGPNQSDFGPR